MHIWFRPVVRAEWASKSIDRNLGNELFAPFLLYPIRLDSVTSHKKKHGIRTQRTVYIESVGNKHLKWNSFNFAAIRYILFYVLCILYVCASRKYNIFLYTLSHAFVWLLCTTSEWSKRAKSTNTYFHAAVYRCASRMRISVYCIRIWMQKVSWTTK